MEHAIEFLHPDRSVHPRVLKANNMGPAPVLEIAYYQGTWYLVRNKHTRVMKYDSPAEAAKDLVEMQLQGGRTRTISGMNSDNPLAEEYRKAINAATDGEHIWHWNINWFTTWVARVDPSEPAFAANRLIRKSTDRVVSWGGDLDDSAILFYSPIRRNSIVVGVGRKAYECELILAEGQTEWREKFTRDDVQALLAFRVATPIGQIIASYLPDYYMKKLEWHRILDKIFSTREARVALFHIDKGMRWDYHVLAARRQDTSLQFHILPV